MREGNYQSPNAQSGQSGNKIVYSYIQAEVWFSTASAARLVTDPIQSNYIHWTPPQNNAINKFKGSLNIAAERFQMWIEPLLVQESSITFV